MLKNLRDFKGNGPIFIDAAIFLHHAFDTNPVSVGFLSLIETSGIRACTSSLVLEEVSFKIVMQSASNHLERVSVPLVKRLLQDVAHRDAVMSPLIHYMDYVGKLQETGMTFIDLKGADIRHAALLAKNHGLITADAAHLAVMARKSIVNVATDDLDFACLPGITVWSPSADPQP